MATDEYIVEALRNDLTEAQAWEMYRRFIGTFAEDEFRSSWAFGGSQVPAPEPTRLVTTRVGLRTARAQRQLGALKIRLVTAEDELRTANETLTVQDETLKMLDDALSVAESLLAEYEEPRVRYQAATGRHLKAA